VVDTAKASAAIQASELASARLRAAIPRLQERQQQAAAAEYERDWRSQYEKVKADRDKLSAEFAQSYPELVVRLADLLGRMAALDKEVSKVNRARPTGVALHLLETELEARGLERFTTAEPEIAKELKLPAFEHSAKLAWPPPQPNVAAQMAAQVAAMMTGHEDPRRYSSRWYEAVEEENAKRRQIEDRRIAEKEQRQAAAKRAYEEDLRLASR
jgi:hypothetical protein